METIAEPIGNLLGGQRRYTGRRQLDRQRDSVQLTANLCDFSGVTVAHCETWRHRVGSLKEQLYRIARECARCGRGFASLRDRQGRDRPYLLTGRPQRFATGGQDAKVITRPQQMICQVRAGADQVFAVVDQKEDTPRAKKLRQSVQQHTCRMFVNSELGRDNRRSQDGAQIWSGVRPGGCRRKTRAGAERRLEVQDVFANCQLPIVRRASRSTPPMQPTRNLIEFRDAPPFASYPVRPRPPRRSPGSRTDTNGAAPTRSRDRPRRSSRSGSGWRHPR